MKKPIVNQKYKDNLFRMLFSEKRELLSLYNAVRGTHYTNVDDLTVNTLEGIIYLSLRNDVSFIIGGEILLYKHQSTWCGNMPLRNLMYVADLYAGMTAKDNIFSSKTIELPRARFVAFYNGSKKLPDRSVQKLSEAYPEILTEDLPEELELVVTVLNINRGHNKELMSQCKYLNEYSIYVDKVREYSKEMVIEEAVEKAIEECISDGVLAEFLRKRRAEVAHVSIYEYDAERHLAQEKEESWDEGWDLGRIEGIGLGVDLGTCTKSIQVIRKQLERGISNINIADVLDVEVAFVEKVQALLHDMPEAEDRVVAGMMLEKK